MARGLNWEIGIDIYTLICIKWITNKNLLYKNINKIKFKKKVSSNREDGGVEGCALSPSCESTGITTNC